MKRANSKQQGAALMVMCVVLVLAASWWLVSTYAANFDRTALDRKHNARVLSRAKHALIGYIAQQATTDDHPGRPPCPEADGDVGDAANEGRAAPNCTLPAVGRFPWRTLGLDRLRDAAGEPLWYVVSPGWRVSAGTLVLNSNTAGQLSLDGAANAAAVLIIAPGAPLIVEASANCTARQQTRAVPAPGMDLRNYLECQNATSPADAAFASAGPAGSFNDQVLAVSARDIWSIVEAAVAARITQEIQPAMQAVLSAPYTTGQWGAGLSAATPMLPFAGTTFPDGSTFPNQGGVPLWRTQGCTAGTDPLCDPTFIQWDLASPAPSLVKSGGSASILSVSCAASTTSQVTCTVRYGGWCGGGVGFLLGGVCRHDFEARVRATAENVGHSVRAFDATALSGFTALSSWSAPIDASGDAAADIRGDMTQPQCNTIIILGLLFPCWAEHTATVTVPAAAFADHPMLAAFFTSTATQWYLNNRWYELTYYAVAPSHSPSGASRNCTVTLDCLTVAGGSLPGNVRALIGLTGHSLDGTARPNASASDYLDSALNRDGDTQFDQKLAGRSFNDRFFAVSNY